MSGFDDLVAAMDTAMVVVTTASRDGERDGCLVGFHGQTSIHPPRYVVWLSRANRTFELASIATHLGVHLVGRDEHGIAERFGGQTGDQVDKLAGIDWADGPGGVPLLASLEDRFVGRIVETHDGDGDHVGFIVAPVEVTGDGPEEPLRLSDADDIDPGHGPDERR